MATSDWAAVPDAAKGAVFPTALVVSASRRAARLPGGAGISATNLVQDFR
jgi:hypothetical protein